MILVLGGTLESREITDKLLSEGFKVTVTVVSDYGAGLIPKESKAEILVCRLNERDLVKLINERNITMIIDATHPYAGDITATAWSVARNNRIPYIRYERPAASTSADSPKKYLVDTYEEAAKLSINLGNSIFLTIGSKNIEPFIAAGKMQNKRIIARVLPDIKVLEQCRDLGLKTANIIALQGPFSIEMNLAMFRQFGADVLVTKDSGNVGGTDTKLEAAARMGIPVVIIKRPASLETQTDKGFHITDSTDEILNKAKEIEITLDKGRK